MDDLRSQYCQVIMKNYAVVFDWGQLYGTVSKVIKENLDASSQDTRAFNQYLFYWNNRPTMLV